MCSCAPQHHYNRGTYDVFTMATFTPWSRFPEFVAGVMAGMLALRYPTRRGVLAVREEDGACDVGVVDDDNKGAHGEMPWPTAVFLRQLPLPWPVASVGSWEWRTSMSADVGAVLFALVITLENLINYLPNEFISVGPMHPMYVEHLRPEHEASHRLASFYP